VNGAPRATLADVVAHINHAVQIAGVDAVGLGSDFDGSVDEWPNLTLALAAVEQTARQMR
jgi:membrane dipeptidase